MATRRSRGSPSRIDVNQLAFDLGPAFQNPGQVAAEQAAADRAMSPIDDSAVQQARVDNPSELMPYRPTPSINPPRPRTQAAGYVKDSSSMFVTFREGAVYQYMGVTPSEWRNFRRVKSPGKAINRTFNHKTYVRRYDLE